MDKFNLKNIKEHPITTITGFGLLVCGFICIFLPSVSGFEALAYIMAGAGLLGVKDPRFPGGTGKAMTMILGIIMILLYCTSCSRKVSVPGGTVTVEDTLAVPVESFIPPDSIKRSLNIDSLLAARPGKVTIIEDTASRAKIKIWKDKYNNLLNVQANCEPDTVKEIKHVPYKVTAECPPVTIKCPPLPRKSRLDKLFDAYKGFCTWLVSIIILLGIVYLVIKAVKPRIPGL